MRTTSDRHVLEIIDVRKPCTVSWAGMRGEGAVRHCGHCRKNVYDLSAIGRADAEELITLAEGDLCVRFRRRADGTVVTADCPPLRRHGRTVRRLALAGVTAVGVAGAAMALPPAGAGCTGITMGEPEMMGAMVAPPLDPPEDATPEADPAVEPPPADDLEAMVMGDIAFVPEDTPGE